MNSGVEWKDLDHIVVASVAVQSDGLERIDLPLVVYLELVSMPAHR